ncbi:hypothetical protein Dimus_026623 [Dionaea muscipula]
MTISTRECSTSPPSFVERRGPIGQMSSLHSIALHGLEFRKAFLILSYIGRCKLEDVTSIEEIRCLQRLQSMRSFESHVWNLFGQRYCDKKDRLRVLDWDSGKSYCYHCHVFSDGSIRFKGPFLNKASTHLQKVVGDENVLIVQFAEEEAESSQVISSISPLIYRAMKDGILVGHKSYQFFVFKDGGKEEKKKNRNSHPVKCYFVDVESFTKDYPMVPKSVHDARRLFMHIHNASSMSNYMVRFSLILSKTITLAMNMDAVCVEYIGDIPCQTDDGHNVCDIDGKPLVHTDGTGFISEDLALRCPRNCYQGSLLSNQNIEKFLESIQLDERFPEVSGSLPYEPPLLIQFRMFHDGRAVKGTVLVNRKLPPKTIQIRPSMIKIVADPECLNGLSINSFEIVGTSNKPRKTRLSKNLIALLSYGKVPHDFFMDIVKNSVTDANSVLFRKRAALRVAIGHGEIDDDFMVARMILSGIPLDEPFIQLRLSLFSKEEMKNLRGGKLPIADCFYVMGTADPTGMLNNGEVCVILETGQILGKVLVYRNPGCHFGDIHILKATYIEALEEIVGNSKYGIFFPTKGPRSIADEIAGGDYDGDLYWVSTNPELIRKFEPSEPWVCSSTSPKVDSLKPANISNEKLEDELFELFITARFNPSKAMGTASDNWLAFMDRLLILSCKGEKGNMLKSSPSCNKERDRLKIKILRLIDIYYDALDATKKGKKVDVPQDLVPEKFPHYMERKEFRSYKSTSILGKIYDEVIQYAELDPSIQVWKLPCFDVELPDECMQRWEEHYNNYRSEMREALYSMDELKNDSAADVNQKYKQMLYGADDLNQSPRPWEEIRVEALAIYHVTYHYAFTQGLARYCGFAWKTAGQALLRIFAEGQAEKPIYCLPSVLREVFH